MSENSKIEWTTHTFNPWWGCEKISDGCANCYAAAFDKRVGGDNWGKLSPRRFFGEKHWAEPLKWDAKAKKAGERHRVFCASMADVFEDRPDLIVTRDKLMCLISETTHLDWLLLTKRPENIDRLMALTSWDDWYMDWPFCDGVWLGTSVENRRYGFPRIDHLRNIPAKVRFLSVEPLLEDLGRLDLTGIGWVIVGGESGHGARPMEADWARSIRDQCQAAGVPFFMKQMDKKTPIPADLMVREFPVVNAAKSARFEFGQTPVISR